MSDDANEMCQIIAKFDIKGIYTTHEQAHCVMEILNYYDRKMLKEIFKEAETLKKHIQWSANIPQSK